MEKDPQPDSISVSTWVNEVDRELFEFRNLARSRESESEQWRNPSIYVIPHSLKKMRSKAYKPQTVSIGPYHHGKPQLESMEEVKKRAFFTFLDRSGEGFECYVNALAPMVEDLKNAYHNLEPRWKNDTQAFLELMIVDGCFLLEIMRSTTTKKPMEYQLNDPVFGNHGKLLLFNVDSLLFSFNNCP